MKFMKKKEALRKIHGGNVLKRLGRSIKKRATKIGKKAVKGAKKLAVKAAKKAGKSKLVRGIVDKAEDVVNSKKLRKIRKKIDKALKENKITRNLYKQAEDFAKTELRDSFQGKGHCGGGRKGKTGKMMMVARRVR